jgi:hypothetical protein
MDVQTFAAIEEGFVFRLKRNNCAADTEGLAGQPRYSLPDVRMFSGIAQYINFVWKEVTTPGNKSMLHDS